MPSDFVDLTVELEHSLVRVFEQEMLNQRNLENARRQVHLSSFTETKLFDSIDRDLKGWITSVDLELWLRERNAATSYTRYERAFRRMDLNRDGRIDFDEFLLMVRPIYNYTSYNSTLAEVRLSSSPSRALRESIAERKEQEISHKLDEIKELRNEINESKIENEREALIYSTPNRDRDFKRQITRASLYADKYRSPAKKISPRSQRGNFIKVIGQSKTKGFE